MSDGIFMPENINPNTNNGEYEYQDDSKNLPNPNQEPVPPNLKSKMPLRLKISIITLVFLGIANIIMATLFLLIPNLFNSLYGYLDIPNLLFIMVLISFIVSLLILIVVIGIFKKRKWAQTIGIVIGIIEWLHLPFNILTIILGITILVGLINKEANLWFYGKSTEELPEEETSEKIQSFRLTRKFKKSNLSNASKLGIGIGILLVILIITFNVISIVQSSKNKIAKEESKTTYVIGEELQKGFF